MTQLSILKKTSHESWTVPDLLQARAEAPELSQWVCDLLFNRERAMEKHRSHPWTQDAYDDLCRMLGRLMEVVDDNRNIDWVKSHCKLHQLIALALMVVDPIPMLRERVQARWITREHLAARIRNERMKHLRAKNAMRRVPRRK